MFLHIPQPTLDAFEHTSDGPVSSVQIIHELSAGNKLRLTMRPVPSLGRNCTYRLPGIFVLPFKILILLHVTFPSAEILRILRRREVIQGRNKSITRLTGTRKRIPGGRRRPFPLFPAAARVSGCSESSSSWSSTSLVTGSFYVIVAECRRFTTHRIVITFLGAPFHNNSSDFAILFQVTHRILVALELTRSIRG